MDLPTTHYDEVLAKPAARTEAAAPQMGILSKISFYLLVAATFLAPLFFIPSQYAPLDVAKSFMLSFFVILSAILYALDAVNRKTFVLPKSVLGYSAVAIVVSTIISVFTSGSVAKSFIGQGFELTSASFILLMVVTAFLVSRFVIRDKEVVVKIYSALLVSFVLLALFHIVRFFAGAGFLSFDLFKNVATTPVGKWYDFAALTAVVGFLSLLGIKFLPLQKSLRVVLAVVLAVSAFLLFVVNSSFLWIIIAIALAMLGVYEYTGAPKGTKFFTRVSVLTLIGIILAIACAWKGNVIATPLVNSFNAQYGELVLPWQMTMDITADTLKEAPIFGAGPNRFGLQYLKYKPAVINQTPFWGAEFSSGFGMIPTVLVTQGVLGGIVWVLFLIAFVYTGIRALRRVTDPLKKFLVSSSYLVSVFLWLLSLVYTPSHATVFLTALFTGIAIALFVREGLVAERVITTNREERRGAFAPVLLYATVLVLIVWAGVYTKKVVAITYFEKGIKELSVKKSTATAQMDFKKALSWDSSDVYYQALSETNIIKINTLAQEMQAEMQKTGTPDQKKSDELVALITDSLKYTKSAQEIDPYNYYNHLAEARISEIGTSLKIENAYANAKQSYANAITVNPMSPALFLNLARLEASQGKIQDAQQYIGRALQLKPNYVEAVFFLSQLQVANNQLQDAMVSTQVAIQLNPTEPLLYFQLGLLAYNDKNYSLAGQAFQKAVDLNGQYANARYFLGLSYARLGKNAEAIAQFEELAKTNPDNQEVMFILGNLKEGKSPFADAQPPIDSKPEKRKTLPVTEKSDTDTTKTTTKKAATTPSPSPTPSPKKQ
jgi:tetratricopeptide (TPR) repeat protein/O-antigen ligase